MEKTLNELEELNNNLLSTLSTIFNAIVKSDNKDQKIDLTIHKVSDDSDEFVNETKIQELYKLQSQLNAQIKKIDEDILKLENDMKELHNLYNSSLCKDEKYLTFIARSIDHLADAINNKNLDKKKLGDEFDAITIEIDGIKNHKNENDIINDENCPSYCKQIETIVKDYCKDNIYNNFTIELPEMIKDSFEDNLIKFGIYLYEHL